MSRRQRFPEQPVDPLGGEIRPADADAEEQLVLLTRGKLPFHVVELRMRSSSADVCHRRLALEPDRQAASDVADWEDWELFGPPRTVSLLPDGRWRETTTCAL